MASKKQKPHECYSTRPVPPGKSSLVCDKCGRPTKKMGKPEPKAEAKEPDQPEG